jgi:hypothetical protein
MRAAMQATVYLAIDSLLPIRDLDARRTRIGDLSP